MKSHIYLIISSLLLSLSCTDSDIYSNKESVINTKPLIQNNAYEVVQLNQNGVQAFRLVGDKKEIKRLKEGTKVLLSKKDRGSESKGYYSVLLPTGEFYISKKIKYTIIPPSYSFISLLNYLYKAWGERSEILSLHSDRQLNHLYELCIVNNNSDTTFKKKYTYRDYISEIENLFNETLDKNEFYSYVQGTKKFITKDNLGEILIELEHNPKSIQFIFSKPIQPSKVKVANARISLNMKPEFIIKMMKYLKNNYDYENIKDFKMTDYSDFNLRKDNIVIYVKDLAFASTFATKIKNDFSEQYTNSFNSFEPIMMKKISNGIVIGEEIHPPLRKNYSFGLLRATAVLEALEESKDKSFEVFLSKVQKQFIRCKVNFFEPYKNLE